MKIAGTTIANGMMPFLIAEISCNHCGDLGKALALIEAAREAGADAVKFQAYTPDTITIDHRSKDFLIQTGPWRGKSLYELYTEAHTPFEWFPKLFKKADDVRIPLFASVFDKTSIDMLEDLGSPAYKIASMEIGDIPLIRYAAATDKPLIISTGMASTMEIMQAIGASKRHNTAFLACVSQYDGRRGGPELYRLSMLQETCDVAGVSDHTIGDTIAVGSAALGTAIIEKHLMLDANDKSHDAQFSMTPNAFFVMKDAVHTTWLSVRDKGSALGDLEQDSRIFRRSLYVVADIKKGERFTEDNVRSIRPGYGMSPAKISKVLRRKASMDISRGTALQKEMVK